MMLKDPKRFWTVILIISLVIVSNSIISFSIIGINHSRINRLEADQSTISINLANESLKTSNRVVEALTGLTKVIGERSQNDQRILELLEEIYAHSQGEKNGK